MKEWKSKRNIEIVVDTRCIVVRPPTGLLHYLEAFSLRFQPISIGSFISEKIRPFIRSRTLKPLPFRLPFPVDV